MKLPMVVYDNIKLLFMKNSLIKKIRFYFSPFFLIKYYLVKDVKSLIARYNFAGDLIDIGCGEKPFKNLFTNTKSYKGIDFKDYSKNKDFVGEEPDYFFADNYLETFKLPFNRESFDISVSFQVLEHHSKPEMLIKEMFRIAQKKGFLILSFPLIGGLHEKQNDYFRFTEYGLKKLLEPYNHEILEIKRQGALFSVISLLFNEYLNNFAGRSKLAYFFSAIIYLPFWVFQYIALFLDSFFKSDEIFINYLVLIKKC